MAGVNREKLSPSVRNEGDLFQRDAKRTIDGINQCPLLRGVLAERVDLVTGSTKRIPHTLGRVPKGFIIVDADEDVTVWRDATQAATSAELPLTASATATVSLWIF